MAARFFARGTPNVSRDGRGPSPCMRPLTLQGERSLLERPEQAWRIPPRYGGSGRRRDMSANCLSIYGSRLLHMEALSTGHRAGIAASSCSIPSAKCCAALYGQASVPSCGDGAGDGLRPLPALRRQDGVPQPAGPIAAALPPKVGRLDSSHDDRVNRGMTTRGWRNLRMPSLT